MFGNHNLRVGELKFDQVLTHNNQLTLVLCVLLLLFTLIIIAERRKISLILRTLFSHRHFMLIQREGNLLKDKSTALVLIFDVLAISTGAVILLSYFLPQISQRVPFLALVGIVFAVLLFAYYIKQLSYNLYAYMFDRKKERTLINQYKFVFLTDTALVLFPMLIIAGYTGFIDIFYVFFGAVAVLFMAWTYRLFKINQNDGRLFNFFLYFCALEILPWLLIVKATLNA